MPEIIGSKFVSSRLPRPAETAHKGECGILGVVAGSYGMAGAAALCINAAYRAGAGLVRGFVPRSVYPIVAVMCPGAVFSPGAFDGAEAEYLPGLGLDALVVGCGLGHGKSATNAVTSAVDSGLPFVLDADGINVCSGRLHELKGRNFVITPHSGEAARALNIAVSAIESDREGAVKELALRSGGTAVLKGHHTLICDGETTYMCPAGNNGMATAGSGDVLAGIIGALLAGGLTPADAAVCGVYIHALAGDAAAGKLSKRSLTAPDIINALPAAFSALDGR